VEQSSTQSTTPPRCPSGRPVRERPLDEFFRRTTREQSPDLELRRQCSKAIHREATRLDAAYRFQMEAVSRARAEEAALLGELIQGVRAALPALVSALLVRDVASPNRPRLVHLRALLLFGEMPRCAVRGSTGRLEGLFLLDDASFLRVRFTGAAAPNEAGQAAFPADRLEGLEARAVLRDHAVEEVADVLAQRIAAEAARRQSQVRAVESHVQRLKAVRILLAR
jgi:hypothetical protein